MPAMSTSSIKETIIRSYCLIVLFLLLSFQCGGQPSCNPSINIVHQPASLCPGQTPAFTATAFDAGSNPLYQWKKNGVPVGNNNPNYSGALAINDRIVCELTTAGCAVNVTVVSNSFVLQPFFEPAPQVTTVASQQVVTPGTIVTFSATNNSRNTNESYQWIVNGNRINGTNSTVFSTAILTDNTVVECIMTTSMCLQNGSGGSTKDYSDPILIRVSKPVKPSVNMPNSFSPNGDGINDVFRIPAGVPIKLKEFSIFDRWGNCIFFTTDASQGWNGNSKAVSASGGTYVYVLRGRYQNQDINLKGFAVLIR